MSDSKRDPGGRRRRVTFDNGRGATLAALLDLPDGEPRASVLFAHCFTCSKDLRSVHTLSRALRERGFGVLRFDFTGLGDSGGEFAKTSFSTNVSDLVAAASFLRGEVDGPLLLVGHSLGGAAMLMAAPQIDGVEAVATIGAPSDPGHLRDGVLRDLDEGDLGEDDAAEVRIGGRPFRIGREFLHDLERHDLLAELGDLGKPLLLLHSPVDEVVSVEHARALYDAARHPKSFVSLDGADHLLLQRSRDAEFVAGILSAWAGRYLSEAAADDDRTAGSAESSDPPEGMVEVRGSRERYATEVRVRHHRLITDEPEKLGGTDRGITPHEALLGALGSCIAITLRMYADRKEMPLEGVRLRLRHSKVEAADRDDFETPEGSVDLIERHLELLGEDLTDEQRERLREIAFRCPVHRTLTSETRVVEVDALDRPRD